MVNPFDLQTALLAKHVQHVVLIHFPIALLITGSLSISYRAGNEPHNSPGLRIRSMGAAVTAVPTVVTRLLAWLLALEGQRPKYRRRLRADLSHDLQSWRKKERGWTRQMGTLYGM